MNNNMELDYTWEQILRFLHSHKNYKVKPIPSPGWDLSEYYNKNDYYVFNEKLNTFLVVNFVEGSVILLEMSLDFYSKEKALFGATPMNKLELEFIDNTITEIQGIMMERINTIYQSALYVSYKVKEVKFRFTGYITSDWIYYVENYHKWVVVSENSTCYMIKDVPLDLSVLDRETKYDFEVDDWNDLDKKIINEYAAMGYDLVLKKELEE